MQNGLCRLGGGRGGGRAQNKRLRLALPVPHQSSHVKRHRELLEYVRDANSSTQVRLSSG